MVKMMTSPSTMPVVKVLVSLIALMTGDALKGSTRLGATVSLVETAPSPGSEDKFVEASVAPRSQPMKSMVEVRRIFYALRV